ncbi:MAG: T9SS type A sorting domain-containing protein [Bacteroidia bacterium]|nr:T9SS type A sorting domain-containing protein [Bacteroidia bacterium]
MKSTNFLKTAFLLGGVASLSAQITVIRDSVEMGAGYANQVYYSLQGGEVGTAPAASWHLAFEIPIRGAAIRANHARGVTVYQTSKDTNGWNTLSLSDTVARLYNNTCRWEVGALNQTASSGNPFDVGWGNYDLITHITTGDSLYIIGLPGGSFRKLWIQRLQGTTYYVRVANLDGSGDTLYEVNKTAASGRNFIYLNLLTKQVLNLEPANTAWDVVFTPYLELLPPNGTPYPVTGVLQNLGVKAARVRLSSSANPDTLTPSAYTLDSCASTIGYDWKRFDMASNSWILADTLYFLIRDKGGNLWRLRFVGFTGSSTGKAVFEKALLQTATALGERASTTQPQVYPQPAREGFFLHVPETSAEVELWTLTGQLLFHQDLLGDEAVFLPRPNHLPSGLYLLRIRTRNGLWTRNVTFE